MNMKQVFTSPEPNKAVFIILKGLKDTNYYVRSVHFRNEAGLKTCLQKLCQELDMYKGTLIYDTEKLYPNERDLVKEYGFKPFGTNTKTLIRHPSDKSEIPFEIEYLLLDQHDNLHVANKSRANRFAVNNMYGVRLSIHEDEDVAHRIVRKS